MRPPRLRPSPARRLARSRARLVRAAAAIPSPPAARWLLLHLQSTPAVTISAPRDVELTALAAVLTPGCDCCEHELRDADARLGWAPHAGMGLRLTRVSLASHPALSCTWSHPGALTTSLITLPLPAPTASLLGVLGNLPGLAEVEAVLRLEPDLAGLTAALIASRGCLLPSSRDAALLELCHLDPGAPEAVLAALPAMSRSWAALTASEREVTSALAEGFTGSFEECCAAARELLR